MIYIDAETELAHANPLLPGLALIVMAHRSVGHPAATSAVAACVAASPGWPVFAGHDNINVTPAPGFPASPRECYANAAAACLRARPSPSIPPARSAARPP